MSQQRIEDFFHHLATICQESHPANWRESLQKILALFGELNQAQEAALWLCDDGHATDWCIHYAQHGASMLCEQLAEPLAAWLAEGAAPGLQAMPDDDFNAPVWLLPIPPQRAPHAALLALVNPSELLPQPRLEQAASLLTPLVQQARASQSMQPASCAPAFDVIGRYRLLTQATQALGDVIDSTEMLRRLGDITLEVMEADRVTILPMEKYEAQQKYRKSGSLLDFVSCLIQHRPDLLDGSAEGFVHIEDVWQEACGELTDMAHQEKFRTALAIPLQLQRRPLGIIVMYRDTVRPFSTEEINLGKALATQAALAINNVHLFNQERDQRDLANAMAQATTALAQTLDQDRVFDQILEQVRRVVPHEASNVMLIEGDHAQIVRWRGYERYNIAEMIGSIVHPLTLPNLRQMMTTHDPVIVRDTHQCPDWVYNEGFEWLRSYTAVPIVIGDEVMGFINIDSAIPGFFDEKHTQRLQTFADYAAIAIQNARLYRAAQEQTEEVARLLDTLQQRQRRLEHLNTVISIVNSVMELDSILQTGLDQALKIAEMVRGRIYIYDQETRELHLRVSRGVAKKDLDFYATYRPGQGTTGRAFANHQVIVDNDPDTAGTAFLPESKDELQAQISAPLMVENQAVGVISLNTSRGHSITPEVAQLIRAIADQLALAIQRGHLAAQMQEQLQTGHYLYELSAAFLGQSDTRSIIFVLLRTLNDLISDTLGTAFYRYADGDWRRARVYTTLGKTSLRERWIAGTAWQEEVPFLDACCRERSLIVAGHNRNKSADAWQRFKEIGIQQMLYFPLSLPNRDFYGVVAIALGKPHALSPYETAMTWASVQQGTAALARAYLYEASRESESRMHAILESSRDGILLVGQEQRVRYLNGQMLKLLALAESPKTWEQRPLNDLIAATREEVPQFASWLDETAQQMSAPGYALTDAEPITYETARGLFLNLHHWPVYSERNELMGALFLLRDVTEQKTLEQLRDDLLNMIVHDMRNPLSVVKNALQILSDPEMLTEADEVIEIARNNTEELLNLVNAILELGRIEGGHFDLCPQAMPLTTPLRRIIRDIALPSSGPTLDLNVSDDLPPLWANPALVARIFQNLLNNALKFVPETAGHIRITARQDGNWIEIEVHNNGPHIPPEVYARLFQKFSTGKHTRRGYGLGLAFCRLAVEAHGGRIWAKNQPEGGVSFYFTLPTTLEMLSRED